MTTHVIDIYDLFTGLHQPCLDTGIDKIFEDYLLTHDQQIDRVVLLWHHDFSTEMFYTVPYTLERFTTKFASIGITDLVFTIAKLATKFKSELAAYNVVYLDNILPMIDYCNPTIPEPSRTDYKNKFLFLPGKLNKENRIGLLAELYKNNLLDNNHGKINVSKTQITSDLASIIDSNINFDEFVNHLTNFYSLEYTSCNAFELSGDMYQETKFSLIAETEFTNGNRYFISEKTIRAIANKHPFVLAGNVGTLVTLKEMGFKTYQEYLPVPDYDLITDDYLRLVAIVKNVKGLLDMPSSVYSKLEQDATYNFERFKQLLVDNRNTLVSFVQHTNIQTASDNNSILTLLNQRALYYFNNGNMAELFALMEKNTQIQLAYEWQQFYDSVKGVDWPEFCEKDKVTTLPFWVQKEIKEFQNS